MREMSLSSLEAEIELKASGLQYLEVFCTRLYQLPNISPDFIQSVEITAGDWGTAGFVFIVHYTVDGTPQVAKEVAESINLLDLSMTFKVTEGDLLDVYNSFKFILKLSPHILTGSVLHWTMEYEKPSDNTPDPTSLMVEVIQLSKDVDDYVANLI